MQRTSSVLHRRRLRGDGNRKQEERKRTAPQVEVLPLAPAPPPPSCRSPISLNANLAPPIPPSGRTSPIPALPDQTTPDPSTHPSRQHAIPLPSALSFPSSLIGVLHSRAPSPPSLSGEMRMKRRCPAPLDSPHTVAVPCIGRRPRIRPHHTAGHRHHCRDARQRPRREKGGRADATERARRRE